MRKTVCPGKSEITINEYGKVIEYAVKVFGEGNVSSWLIAGLEPVESTIQGIDFIIEHGGIPFLAVFRPLVGSAFEKLPPPEPQTILPAFEYLQEALSPRSKLLRSSSAGCVNCGCCSALPET